MAAGPAGGTGGQAAGQRRDRTALVPGGVFKHLKLDRLLGGRLAKMVRLLIEVGVMIRPSSR